MYIACSCKKLVEWQKWIFSRTKISHRRSSWHNSNLCEILHKLILLIVTKYSPPLICFPAEHFWWFWKVFVSFSTLNTFENLLFVLHHRRRTRGTTTTIISHSDNKIQESTNEKLSFYRVSIMSTHISRLWSLKRVVNFEWMISGFDRSNFFTQVCVCRMGVTRFDFYSIFIWCDANLSAGANSIRYSLNSKLVKKFIQYSITRSRICKRRVERRYNKHRNCLLSLHLFICS